MGEFRLSPRAQRDLEGIFDYSLAEWGLEQALHYTDMIATACTNLAAAPLRAQDCSDIRPGYRRWGVGQHVIYFRTTSYGIAVTRILHGRMEAVRHI